MTAHVIDTHLVVPRSRESIKVKYQFKKSGINVSQTHLVIHFFLLVKCYSCACFISSLKSVSISLISLNKNTVLRCVLLFLDQTLRPSNKSITHCCSGNMTHIIALSWLVFMLPFKEEGVYWFAPVSSFFS